MWSKCFCGEEHPPLIIIVGEILEAKLKDTTYLVVRVQLSVTALISFASFCGPLQLVVRILVERTSSGGRGLLAA